MKKDYYYLEFPYSDDRELTMDILRYGPQVEVLKPESLRKKIKQQARQVLDIYKE